MNNEKREHDLKPAGNRSWLLIVLVAVLLAGVSLFESLRYFRPEHAYKSGDALRQESLPDGSTVILNKKSRLTLGDEWKKDLYREAWLEGEGFFSTVNTEDTNGVTIHTPRFDVVGKAARFNVFNRANSIYTWLQQGEAYILTHDSKPRRIPLSAGDMVRFEKGRFVTTPQPDSALIRWKDNP